MVTISYHVGDESCNSTICVEMSPLELGFIAKALAFYVRRSQNLRVSQILLGVGLQVECAGAVNEYKVKRELIRKEGSL